jgi:hypothetical protein
MCARCAHRAGAPDAPGATSSSRPPGAPMTVADLRALPPPGTRHPRVRQCGKIAPIAVRAREDAPDICADCYRMPSAVCSVCGRWRECNFATSEHPVCPASPRATVPGARCGAVRPPAARCGEGPLCDPCYTAALRHRGRCDRCGNQRRLVAPPGPAPPPALTAPGTHACTSCGIEDKLYEQGRCARCSLARRAGACSPAEPGGSQPS